jgi:hypothetical protein
LKLSYVYLNPTLSTKKNSHDNTITQIEKILYTAKAHTTGGREELRGLLTANWTLSLRFLALTGRVPIPSSCSL